MTWRATVLTIFPEMFPGALGLRLAGKALAEGKWALDLIDIRDFATEGVEEESGADDDRLPSFRRLAAHLKIPRDRFSGLMSTLRSFLERCLEELEGNLARAREVRS